ncbi:MAG: ABC transporter ATP-binding protein [Nitriliruptoraceae bacterium]
MTSHPSRAPSPASAHPGDPGGPTGRAAPAGPGDLSLSAQLRLQLGTLDLDVRLDAAPGQVVAVVGPNGAGKTTLLRAVAGLLPLADGRIRIGDLLVEDPSAGVRVPPQQRRVGVVFQQHLLFPHLTALENVAFGLRARGVDAGEARTRAGEWLERVGLDGVARAKPAALSGGQSQRVALARALATDPALLLLDEPMAALDVDARRAVRRELTRHLDAFTGPTLLVTHDPLEAISLADRIVVLEAGRIVQDDAPATIARRPRSAWAARLVGLNHYHGHLDEHTVTLDNGARLTVADGSPAGEVMVTIHPRAVALHPDRPHGSPRNVWQATVDSLDIHHDHIRVHLDGSIPIVSQVTAAALADLELSEGRTVWAAVKATEIDHWPR